LAQNTAPAPLPFKPAKALVEEGVALHDEGKYEDAIVRYRQVLPGDSTYARAQAELALSLMMAGKYQESADAARRAQQLDPFEPQNYATLADDYEGLKQLPEARQTYAASLKLFPYSENLWLNQGILELNQRQLAAALPSLERAVELRPGKSSGHRLLGAAAVRQGQLAHAMISLLTFLAIEPLGERSHDVLVSLESLSQGLPVVEPADQAPPVAPNAAFEELDQLIAAKVALTPSYTSKVKFKAAIVKQLQLLVEKFPVTADPASDFWVRAYAPLVKALQQGDNLTAFTYLILQSADDKSAQQWVKTNKSRIDKLSEAISGPLLSLRDQQPLAGAATPVAAWYDEGMLEAIGTGERDAKGEIDPVGNWVLIGKDGSIEQRGAFGADHKRTGKWQQLRPDGSLEGELHYVAGELDGPVRHYYPGGQLRSEATYRAGKADGTSKKYSEDGHVLETRQLAKGDFEGEAVDYYASTRPSFKVLMHADEKSGALERYYPDGTVQLHEQYAQGKAQGEHATYYPDKTPERKMTFAQDEPTGAYSDHYPNGQPRETGQFARGKRAGTWREYFSNGKLSVEKNYDEAGELHGAYQDYDWQGRHYSDSQYEHGRLVRATSLDPATGKPRPGADYNLRKGRTTLKAYDADGQLHSTGDVENGNLVGEWKTYYPDGTLRDLQHYDAKGVRTGLGETYYANGQLRLRHTYDASGQTTGYFEQYYPDGQLQQTGYELNGQNEGQWKSYHPNGQLSQERQMFRDELSGETRSFTPTGQLTESRLYAYGHLKQLAAYDSTAKVLSQQTVTPATKELLLYFPGSTARPLLSRAALVNGTYEGAFAWLLPNGQPESTMTMREGKRYGPYRRQYAGGQTEMEVPYLDGKRYGLYTAYFADGAPRVRGRYLNDEQVGEWTHFFANGQVQRTMQYNDEGDLDGTVRLYNPAGELLLERRYVRGRLVGFAGPGTTAGGAAGTAQALPLGGGPLKTAFANGKPAAAETFAHNYPSGTFTYYYASGQLYRRESYLKGVMSGPRLSYWPSGKPLAEENYLHDELNGRCRYYRPDGTLEREETYRVGERQGPSVTYDAKGRVLRREYYWNNALYNPAK
jgi:antitoxin component YwqK of YwqJK toxin-antitoxin module/tetratricopeptide (TPR) repeat protein